MYYNFYRKQPTPTMKHLLFILLASMSAMTVFAQDYSEEEILALNDSLNTNPEDVSRWCDAEINKATKNPDVYLLKSMYLSIKEDYKSAIKYIDKAIKYTKDDSRISKAGVFYLRGMTCLYTKDYDKAIKSFSNSIKFDSTLIDSYKERVELYFKKEEYDLATKDAKKIIELDPKFENVLFYARCEAKQGNYEEALETFNFVIENKPNCSEAYQYRAETHRNLGNNKSAINDYIKFIDLTGTFNAEYLSMISKNEFEYTISYLSDLIRLDSENSIWLLSRMILYVTEEKYDLAKADLDLFKNSYSSELYNEIKKSSYYTIIMENTK